MGLRIVRVPLACDAAGADAAYTTRPPLEGSKLAPSGVTHKFTFTAARSACTAMPSNSASYLYAHKKRRRWAPKTYERRRRRPT